MRGCTARVRLFSEYGYCSSAGSGIAYLRLRLQKVMNYFSQRKYSPNLHIITPLKCSSTQILLFDKKNMTQLKN